jgi:hypothetical protein
VFVQLLGVSVRQTIVDILLVLPYTLNYLLCRKPQPPKFVLAHLVHTIFCYHTGSMYNMYPLLLFSTTCISSVSTTEPSCYTTQLSCSTSRFSLSPVYEIYRPLLSQVCLLSCVPYPTRLLYIKVQFGTPIWSLNPTSLLSYSLRIKLLDK